jgi:pimeloyl-ACP methyl ester carboxylesterase
MRSPVGIIGLAAALAGLLLVTVCATGYQAGSARPKEPVQPAHLATPGTTSPDESAPPALDGCFTASRGTIETVPDAGGGTLTLAIIGNGPRAVILSNESDENLCSWLPLAARLSASGYRVVLWDYGGHPAADELRGLVKRLRSSGATRIVLLGASEGAKASLVASARIALRVRGVVSLSAESILAPAIVVADSVRRMRCPVLLITADQDPYGSAQAARQFLADAHVGLKRLVAVPGADHGTALLSGRSGATTLPAIVAFLRQVLGR